MFIAALLAAVSTLGASHVPPARRSVPAATVRETPSPDASASDDASTITVSPSVVAVMGRIKTRSNFIPAFARKMNVACSFCHTTIPRLNTVGYKFRAAGFRMPEDIGNAETKKFDFGDNISARIQSRFDVQVTNTPNGAAVANMVNGKPGDRTTTIAPSLMEATVYPLSGSWGKYFGSLSELSVSPEDFFEIENAYIRGVWGTEKSFFTSRVGVFHPFEGIGASDRPYSNGRTLFQTSGLSSGGRGVPYVYQPWGLDEVGAELGWEWENVSVRGAVLGGTFMRWDSEANSFIPFPSQTGPWKGANQAVSALGKPFDYVDHNAPDYSAHVMYRFDEEGGAISLLYYKGNIATPTKCTDGTAIGATNSSGVVCGVTASSAAAPFGAAGNTDFDFSAGSAFRNDFDRTAVYASYPIGKKFLPSVGYQRGTDSKANGSTITSTGMFVEGAYTFSKYVTAGGRYDTFRPNDAVNSRQWAFTPFVNIPLQNGLQIISEYQHRDFELAPGTYHRQNDSFQIRVIFIQ